MSTTTAAVIGTITTGAVAVAAFLFHYVTSRSTRAAARVLAWDMHSQALELARDTRQHEQDARRAERNYDGRRRAYLAALDWALPVVRDPGAANGGAESARMQVDLVAFGSSDVRARFAEFSLAAQSAAAAGATDDQRQAAVASFDALCEAINAELAETPVPDEAATP